MGSRGYQSSELGRTIFRAAWRIGAHRAEAYRGNRVEREIGVLRAAGSACNINIDLIAGLPGQTRESSWAQSLSWIERLQLSPRLGLHVSCEIDEDSRLGQEVLLNGKRYGAPDVPSDDHHRRAAIRNRRSRDGRVCGIQRYEISNFARPGFESLHNLKYWQLEPYAGFGADAHSFDGAMRGQNIESPSDYVKRPHRNGDESSAHLMVYCCQCRGRTLLRWAALDARHPAAG